MPTPATTPIGLTDEQMSMVYSASAPLEPRARSAFLAELANALRGRGEIGDGELHQVIRETQRKYFTGLRSWDVIRQTALSCQGPHPLMESAELWLWRFSRAASWRQNSRSTTLRAAALCPGGA
jgi:hypothetical protein